MFVTTLDCDFSTDNTASFSVDSITSSLTKFSFTNNIDHTPVLSPMSASPADQSVSVDDQNACAPNQEVHDIQLLDLSSTVLHLEANQPHGRAHKHQVITRDVSNNEAKNASLVEKQICLLNLCYVACHHGLNLQELHPDAFTNTQNNATTNNTTTKETLKSSDTSTSISPQKDLLDVSSDV